MASNGRNNRCSSEVRKFLKAFDRFGGGTGGLKTLGVGGVLLIMATLMNALSAGPVRSGQPASSAGSFRLPAQAAVAGCEEGCLGSVAWQKRSKMNLWNTTRSSRSMGAQN